MGTRCRVLALCQPPRSVHQYVTARPRDVRACGEETVFFLVKRRMECPDAACPRLTFTESAPQVPPRCTITSRLLGHAAAEVADRGITPAEAARDAGISWHSVHGAFTKAAGGVLGEDPAPVAHLGIRRAPPRQAPLAHRRADRGERAAR